MTDDPRPIRAGALGGTLLLEHDRRARKLEALPPAAPVVLMIHGWRYAPGFAPAGQINQVILLAAAETRKRALAALASTAGHAVEVVNATTLQGLAQLGPPLADPPHRICHWSPYLRPEPSRFTVPSFWVNCPPVPCPRRIPGGVGPGYFWDSAAGQGSTRPQRPPPRVRLDFPPKVGNAAASFNAFMQASQ